MARISVVTDSISNLPPAVVAEYGISVVPIYLHWAGQAFKDGVDITPDEVYARLRQSTDVPSTAAPSAGDYLQTYLGLSQEADGIVSVHTPRELSASIQAAEVAADLVKEIVQVRVIDAGSAAMAAGFVALEAAREAAAGANLAGVSRAAKALSGKVKLFVMLDTLKYLYRSGRIGRAASLAGSLLDLKPIVYINNNVVDVLAKPRTSARAVRMILDRMEEEAGDRPVHVAVMHGDAPKEAQALRDTIEAQFNCVEVMTTTFTPVMGASSGPGLLGIAFYAEG